jgi:capsular polysaccharide export protein
VLMQFEKNMEPMANALSDAMSHFGAELDCPLHFAFLQGMPSPFFSRIAQQLSAKGARVTGINLCFGDWLFWSGPGRLNYRGTIAAWPKFFADFIDRNKVTDIVLLGEQRSYHKLAVEVAKAKNIRITVTDFGYLRPDWITLEKEGMSGNSQFPKTLDELLPISAQVPKADLSTQYADSSWKMAIGDLLYSFGNVFFFWLFPHYRRSDKRAHPLVYFPAIGKRLAFAKLQHRRAQQQVARFFTEKIRYFLFPLQLEHDFQIVAYSPFDGLEEPIRLVIKSFAEHADANTRLVLKAHPWDPGLRDFEKLVARLSVEFGIRDRVAYLDGGNLDELISASAGMVTVNSTSGLRALQLGCPVKTLGQAIYDMAGLTYQGDLDHFWTEAAQPDPVNVEAFINVMAATIQIRGVFFNEPGLSAAVRSATERLVAGTVGTAAGLMRPG